jgi:hypothetical protein
MSLRKMTGCVALLLLCVAVAFGQTDPKGGKGIRPPMQPPTQVEEGRFRVTLTGFTVNLQTRDNVLETDGKGDEVYVLTEIAQYDSYVQKPNTLPFAGTWLGYNDSLRGRASITARRSLLSVLMGDVNNQNNPPRIKAGSASGLGGLRTGDRFPTNEPWILSGAPNTDRLPMLLWEGQLRRGRDLAVIAPTIWEWDGGNQPLRAQFTQDINQYFFPVIVNPFEGVIWRGLTGLDLFGAGDRPIGMLGNRNWFPRALVLNYDTALNAATTSPGQFGTGVIELNYLADAESYSLYFKIERLS